MRVLHHQGQRLLAAALICFVCSGVVQAADETTLTKEQIETFLTTAKIVGSKPAGKGVTGSWRLTLSDGTTTHDGAFQAINETKTDDAACQRHRIGFRGFLPL